jgi:hypothetical protein
MSDETLIEPGEVIPSSMLSGALSLTRSGGSLDFACQVMKRGDPLAKHNVSRDGLSEAHRQFVFLASRVTHDFSVIALALCRHYGLANPTAEQLEQVRGLVRRVLFG